MKTIFSTFARILLFFVLGITGCTSQVNQPPPTQLSLTQPPPTSTPLPEATTDPVSAIVLGMVERMNAGDLEGSLAYFSDDAIGYIMGLPPTGMEVYTGKEQIRTLWQDSIDNHFHWEVKITQVVIDEVYVRAKTWHDFTRQLGVAPLEYSDIYEVKDGKITTYGTTITEESLAKLKPALAEVMPPESPAAPSSDPPLSEMTVTIAGGTCSTNGPITLQAGKIKVTLNIKDQNKVGYALLLVNLDQGKDFPDLMAATVGMPPSWADELLFAELLPGGSAIYTFTVEKGPVYLICWSKYPELPIGNAGPFDVKQ